MGVADEVLREKKKNKRERESWNVLEFGGSDRDKKWKEVKKEKCKGTCVEEKKKGKRRRKKCGTCVKDKKEGKKEEERNGITIFSQ